MEQATAKIRVKLGQIEVDYEGESSFLKENLAPMVAELIRLYREHQHSIDAPSDGADGDAQANTTPRVRTNLSTNTIANVLGAQSGSDLARAASAYLALVKNKATFTRQEINDEMKTASSYYKATYSSNLTKSLKVLCKEDRLRLGTKETYSLSAKERKELEETLAKQG